MVSKNLPQTGLDIVSTKEHTEFQRFLSIFLFQDTTNEQTEGMQGHNSQKMCSTMEYSNQVKISRDQKGYKNFIQIRIYLLKFESRIVLPVRKGHNSEKICCKIACYNLKQELSLASLDSFSSCHLEID